MNGPIAHGTVVVIDEKGDEHEVDVEVTHDDFEHYDMLVGDVARRKALDTVDNAMATSEVDLS